MKKIVLWMALGLAGAADAAPRFECDRSPLLVRNVDVWTPAGMERRRDVLVADGRVREIAATGRIEAPGGTRILEGNGQLMLPGFVDLHVHFVFPGPVGDRKGDPGADALAFGRQMLASGVTSARVHLDSFEHALLLKELAADECSPMPRLQFGGPAFIPGTGNNDQAPVWDVTGVDDARAKVRRIADSGFQWIAIHDAQKFPAESRAAIVEAARGLNLRILASGYTQPELEASLQIQPDTIDYLDVSTQPEYAPALIEAARMQKQLTWVARIGIHDRYRAYQEKPELIDEPSNYEFFDTATAEALRAGVRRATADRGSEHAKRMDGAYPTLHRKFQQLLSSGIALAMGTDVGSPGQFQRNAIWWEFDSWVKHGASVDVALTAAAITGAKVLHREDAAGLKAGARADFVLCTADTFRKKPIDGRGCRGFRSGLTAAK
jgi:imidazolonepropionase-like amidohydrolase